MELVLTACWLPIYEMRDLISRLLIRLSKLGLITSCPNFSLEFFQFYSVLNLWNQVRHLVDITLDFNFVKLLCHIVHLSAT